MKVLKGINVDDAVYAKFKAVADSEGRTVGKMLEIIVNEYIRISKAVDAQIEKKDD